MSTTELQVEPLQIVFLGNFIPDPVSSISAAASSTCSILILCAVANDIPDQGLQMMERNRGRCGNLQKALDLGFGRELKVETFVPYCKSDFWNTEVVFNHWIYFKRLSK